MSKPDAAECRRRAELMTARVGLVAANDEEAAIIFKFHSAYHTVKAAFVDDPIFDDIRKLSARSVQLTLEDQYATSHSGRNISGGRIPGVNDVVGCLYPHIVLHYLRLHRASIDVRYNGGLSTITPTQADVDWRTVLDAYRAGTLKAA